MAAVEAAPRWELRFRGKKVIQEGFVNLNRGIGPGEFWETRGLSGSDKFLRRPYVVGCRFC